MAHDVWKKKSEILPKKGETHCDRQTFPFLCLAHLPPYAMSEKVGIGGKRQEGKPPRLVTGGGQTMRK